MRIGTRMEGVKNAGQNIKSEIMETFYPIIPINRIKTPAKIKEISILTDFQVFHLFGTFFSTRSENLHFPIKFCCIVQFIADVILPGFPPFFYISIYVLFQDFFPTIYCFPFTLSPSSHSLSHTHTHRHHQSQFLFLSSRHFVPFFYSISIYFLSFIDFLVSFILFVLHTFPVLPFHS